MMDRRQLITGLISLVAAPAIVRAGGLMPIKIIRPFLPTDLEGLIYWGSFRGIYFSNKALTPAGVAEIDGYLAGAYGPPQSSVDSP